MIEVLKVYELYSASSPFGQSSSRFQSPLIIRKKTSTHTAIKSAAMTQPKICRPLLLNAAPIANVAVTNAVLGKTKLHHVI